MRLTPLWYQSGEYAAQVDRELIAAVFPTGGTLGMAPSVVASSRNVMIAAGKCAVPLGDGTAVLCVETAGEQVQIAPSPPAGQNRVDVIIVRPREGADVDFIFDVVQGTPANPPAPIPPTPPGTFALARVTSPGGQAFINPADLTDVRSAIEVVGRQLAYAETGTAQSGIGTALVDLVGLNTGPFTLTSRRRVELVANVNVNKAGADSTNWANVQIANAANVAQGVSFCWITAPGWAAIPVIKWLTLDPGTYTFKCRASTGSGFLNMTGGTSNMIGVRDLGPG